MDVSDLSDLADAAEAYDEIDVDDINFGNSQYSPSPSARADVNDVASFGVVVAGAFSTLDARFFPRLSKKIASAPTTSRQTMTTGTTIATISVESESGMRSVKTGTEMPPLVLETGPVDCVVAVVDPTGGSMIDSGSVVAVVVAVVVVVATVDVVCSEVVVVDGFVVGMVVGVVFGAVDVGVGDSIVDEQLGDVQLSLLFEHALGVVGHSPRQFPASEHDVSAVLSPLIDVKKLELRFKLLNDESDDRSSTPCRPQPTADSVCSIGNEKL